MKNKLNQKGFTLIELLATLVILVVILRIAIPSISSSIERTKEKQNQARYKIIIAAAESYVTDNKNAVYNKLNTSASCYLKIADLPLLSSDDKKDSDGNDLREYYITFTKPSEYKFIEDGTTGGASISCIN